MQDFLDGPADNDAAALFAAIAQDIYRQGYSVQPNALPQALSLALLEQAQRNQAAADFKPAGTGRQTDWQVNRFVRRDEICWIDGSSEAGADWLDWAANLQRFLNRRLLLGLFSFESHFAHYRPGDFYRKHLDAFRGQANRVLSLVLYLNPGWLPEDGGELALEVGTDTDLKVTPAFGTVALFLSEEFPHEVLPTTRDRYSIAGWYRLNNSLAGVIDPPA